MIILPELTINTDLMRRTIVQFVRDQITQAGYARALLGLSGGIDSALTCYLAVEALGAENVLALLMPYRTSSPESEADARLIIETLGIPHRQIPITPMVEPFLALDPQMDARRLGNIMARLRMIILYDQSVAFKGLVLGTSNKAEILLGYFTVYGDSAAAIRPLAHLYKCQVRQLAQAVGVPERIIAKAPSADLWADQTDEGELGFLYDEADQVLYLHVDRGLDEAAIVRRGFAPDLVRRVLQRMRATAFKRREPAALEMAHQPATVKAPPRTR